MEFLAVFVGDDGAGGGAGVGGDLGFRASVFVWTWSGMDCRKRRRFVTYDHATVV